jgi:hypothetical protein
LPKFNGQRLLESIIKYGIAGLVNEVGQDDGVFLGESGLPGAQIESTSNESDNQSRRRNRDLPKAQVRGSHSCTLAIYANYRRDEAVATAGQGLNKARAFRRVSQRLPQFVDGRVEAVVEIDKRICRPDLRTQLFPSDDFPRSSQQNLQNKKRLLLQLDTRTLLAQFAGAQVDLEDPKPQQGGRSTLKGPFSRISPPS